MVGVRFERQQEKSAVRSKGQTDKEQEPGSKWDKQWVISSLDGMNRWLRGLNSVVGRWFFILDAHIRYQMIGCYQTMPSLYGYRKKSYPLSWISLYSHAPTVLILPQ